MKMSDPQLVVQSVLTALAFIGYLIAYQVSVKAVEKYGGRQEMIEQRVLYIRKFFSISIFSIFLGVLAVIWGIDFKGVVIVASSFFTLVGISLFASWSILSNITCSVLLFFLFPYKIGDKIRIIDGDNSVSGKLVDMTLFCMIIENEEGGIVSYPNNLAMQKPVVKIDIGDFGKDDSR